MRYYMCLLKSFVISGVTITNSIKTTDETISPKEGLYELNTKAYKFVCVDMKNDLQINCQKIVTVNHQKIVQLSFPRLVFFVRLSFEVFSKL